MDVSTVDKMVTNHSNAQNRKKPVAVVLVVDRVRLSIDKRNKKK